MSSTGNTTILPPRLQPLGDWATQNLTAMITASSDNDFETAFNQFVSEHVKKIMVNNREMTREEYRKMLLKERGKNFISAMINIHDVVEVPKLKNDGEANEASGNVGMFYDAQYRDGRPNAGAFDQHGVRSSLNIEVEQDSTVRGPVFEERRRVFMLNQVYLEQSFGIESASS